MDSLPIDDQDAAMYSVGQVAEMLQVTQAFMRRLDELAVICPARSAAGQRRYSRRQIATVARVRALAGEGLTLVGVRRVLALEDRISELVARLEAARAEAARLRAELASATASPRPMPDRCSEQAVAGESRVEVPAPAAAGRPGGPSTDSDVRRGLTSIRGPAGRAAPRSRSPG